MHRRFHFAAVYIALAAMVLRALVPLGWMPSASAAGVPLAICTMQGAITLTLDAHGKPQKPANGTHHTEACPFAAAPHLSTPVVADAVATPNYRITTTALSVAPDIAVAFTRHTPQSPRAPPAFA